MPGRIPKTLSAIVSATLLSAPGTAISASFPAQLLGKSVTIRWTMTWRQKFEGINNTTFRAFSNSLRIYFSNAGRTFSKEMVIRVGARGPAGDGPTTESAQAPDDVRNSAGDDRVIHFDGGALHVDTSLIAGVRRVAITFDTGYGSCAARVIYGREGGSGPIRERGLGGRQFEAVSIQTSAPSCSITSGNVFGGQ